MCDQSGATTSVDIKSTTKDHPIGEVIRILHMGNIANNAYLNAKMLNNVGCKCDVMCNDYYHIMGCPEWEDADFEAERIDEFKPDWSLVDLNGFVRPEWFIQAPFSICCDLLRSPKNKAGKTEQLQQAYFIGLGMRDNPVSRQWFIKKLIDLICYRQDQLNAVYGKVKVVVGVSTIIQRLTAKILTVLLLLVFFTLKILIRPIINYYRWDRIKNYQARVAHAVKRFKKIFPRRVDSLTADDFTAWTSYFMYGKKVYKNYDLVHAYATYGVLPYIAEMPYVVYEHGTIRHLPFQDSTEGRLCALSYAEADHVFITNADNIKAAHSLGLERFTFVPHPINEDFLLPDQQAYNLRDHLCSKLSTDFIVFHPSRQHWDEQRHPDWEKGNDIFIIGLARFIKEINPAGSAVFVEWGKKINESKHLLDNLGIADRVLWVPPLPNRQMIRYIHATDALADQFYLGAFGSTMPKALACGKPALLKLDVSLHNWCFEEMPPIINTASPDDVFAGLRRLYLDHDWAASFCRDGKLWYERFHSNKVIVDKLTAGYDSALNYHAKKLRTLNNGDE